jgi:p-hydroxybenzoate 3-monooxygenase
VLADALVAWLGDGFSTALDEYFDRCLLRVWRAALLLVDDDDAARRPDSRRLRARAAALQLENVCSSTAAATSLAENYVGLPVERLSRMEPARG